MKSRLDERVCREGAAGRAIRDALEDLYFGAFHLVNTIPGGDSAADALLHDLEMSFVDGLQSLRHYEEEIEKARKLLEASPTPASTEPR